MADVFTYIINNPDEIIKIPELYEFNIFCIQKDADNEKAGDRPISIQETILNIFHKLLVKEIRRKVSPF